MSKTNYAVTQVTLKVMTAILYSGIERFKPVMSLLIVRIRLLILIVVAVLSALSRPPCLCLGDYPHVSHICLVVSWCM